MVRSVYPRGISAFGFVFLRDEEMTSWPSEVGPPGWIGREEGQGRVQNGAALIAAEMHVRGQEGGSNTDLAT